MKKNVFWRNVVLAVSLISVTVYSVFASQEFRGTITEYMINQETSINAYQKMIDSFIDNDGIYVFPDYYGGSYLNEVGRIVTLLTEKSDDNCSDIRRRMNCNNVIIREVQHSYNVLQQEYEHWVSLRRSKEPLQEDLKEALTYLVGEYVNEKQNCVIMWITETSQQVISVLKKYSLFPDTLQFEKNTEGEACSTIKPGGGIFLHGTSYSMGYRCYFYEDGASEPDYGFVTAGHGTTWTENCRIGSASGTIVGYIDRRQFSGSVDASVIALYSPHVASKYTAIANNIVTTIETGTLLYGQQLYKEGIGNSAVVTGQVFGPNCDYTYNGQMIDHLVMTNATLSISGGDSGAVVYRMSGSDYKIIGIVAAVNGFGMGFICRATYINCALVLTVY